MNPREEQTGLLINRHSASRTIVVRVLGHLDAVRVDYYRKQLRSLIEQGYRNVIFDMGTSDFINSSGIGLLVELYHLLNDQSGTFRLINCQPGVLRLLKQVDLDRLLIPEQARADEEPAPDAAPTPQFDELHAMMSDEILALSLFKEQVEQVVKLGDAESIGRSLLEGTLSVINARFGLFYMMEEGGRRLRPVAWKSREGEEGLASVHELTLSGDGWVKSLIEAGDIHLHRLNGTPGVHQDLLRAMGFDHMLSVPVRAHNHMMGLLLVESGEHTERMLATVRPILLTLTQLGAMAMEHHAGTLDPAAAQAESGDSMLGGLSMVGHMATLGALVSGLVHHFNNKMMPLVGYAQMLSKMDLPEDAARRIQSIRTASEELRGLLDRTLLISRLQDPTPTHCNLIDLVREALQIHAGLIHERGIRVNQIWQGDLVPTLADRALLLQALLVILHRSLCALGQAEGSPQLTLKIETHDDRVTLTIKDNGRPYEPRSEEESGDPLLGLESINEGFVFSESIPRSLLSRMKCRVSFHAIASQGNEVVLELPVDAPHPLDTP